MSRNYAAVVRVHPLVLGQPAGTNPLIMEFLNFYLGSCGRAQKSALHRGVALRSLASFLAERFDLPVDDPDLLLLAEPRDLAAWATWLSTDHSRSTRAGYACAVRTFYKWAASGVSGRLIPWSPATDLPIPSAQRGLPRPIPDEDLYRALDHSAAELPEMYCWLMLAAGCGLRAGGIAGLSGEDIRVEHGSEAPLRLSVTEKGSRSRVRDGGPGVLEALRPFWRQRRSGALFRYVNADGQLTRITAQRVSHRVSDYFKIELGIRDYTLHSLRHWFASVSFAERRDIRATQEALGHRSLASTMPYVQLVDGSGPGLGAAVDQVLRTRQRTPLDDATRRAVRERIGLRPATHDSAPRDFDGADSP